MYRVLVLFSALLAFVLLVGLWPDAREFDIRNSAKGFRAKSHVCASVGLPPRWEHAPSRLDEVLGVDPHDLHWLLWWDAWSEGCVGYQKFVTRQTGSCRQHVRFSAFDFLGRPVGRSWEWIGAPMRDWTCRNLDTFLGDGMEVREVL